MFTGTAVPPRWTGAVTRPIYKCVDIRYWIIVTQTACQLGSTCLCLSLTRPCRHQKHDKPLRSDLEKVSHSGCIWTSLCSLYIFHSRSPQVLTHNMQSHIAENDPGGRQHCSTVCDPVQNPSSPVKTFSGSAVIVNNSHE